MFEPVDLDAQWRAANAWESQWWGDCLRTYGEETKQLTYAHRMGIESGQDSEGRWPVMDLGGRGVLDIGGGPCSMLLRCTNSHLRVVVDPCQFPDWVARRYAQAGIRYVRTLGEHFEPEPSDRFDEVWLYNVLQHTQNPYAVAAVARQCAPVVRVFEWINTELNIGHPHSFNRKALDFMFGGKGAIEQMVGENSLWGTAWYGVFAGERSD